MRDDITVGELTQTVANASTEFEKTSTDLKRKYLIWSIDTFNSVASHVSVSKGSFGTGYPFYALDKDLKGTLPIITEQIRYNRQLVIDGIPVQKSIWKCKSCLRENYDKMPDLKTVCKPCPNILSELKPRKLINRLPDMDMWLVCEDGKLEQAEKELTELFEKNKMRTSDVNPILSMEDIVYISEMLKKGVMPEIHLPIDAHIIEYSILKELIKSVPTIIKEAERDAMQPYLPIHPKSYRKQWQYDDEAYNYIYDFLSAFTEFNFEENLQQALDESRKIIATEYTPDKLFAFLLQSANEANFRRFHTAELEVSFKKRINNWKISNNEKITQKKEIEELEL